MKDGNKSLTSNPSTTIYNQKHRNSLGIAKEIRNLKIKFTYVDTTAEILKEVSPLVDGSFWFCFYRNIAIIYPIEEITHFSK